MDTVAKGEQIEGEIEAFIRRRDQQRCQEEGPRSAEALYAESCREHEDRERRREL